MEFSLANFLAALAVALVSGALSFVAASLLARRRHEQDVAAVAGAAARGSEDRMHELERQIAVLGQQVLPISTAFQAILIKQLTHYHTPELDELLRKVGPPFTLNAAEERQLAKLLEERTRDVDGLIDSSERDAAKMLPMIMARVRAEHGAVLSDMELLLVAVQKTADR